MEDTVLTTIDNPYNPFTDFENWFQWDLMKGYRTCEYLARVSQSSNELSEADEAEIISNAQKEIVKNDALGNYIIVTKKTAPKLLELNKNLDTPLG